MQIPIKESILGSSVGFYNDKLSELMRSSTAGSFAARERSSSTWCQSAFPNGLPDNENKIIESFENYLRAKFFNSKNNKTIEKKLKTYKTDISINQNGKDNHSLSTTFETIRK